jgi:hypothetical protein
LNAIANLHCGYFATNFDNFTGDFVADNLRWLKPWVAVVKYLGIGATGSTGVNAKLYFLGSCSGLFYLLNFEILGSPVNCCLHF